MHHDLILTGILQGLVLTLVTYALVIPFRLLNFTDLTAEGAYPLGGGLCATLLVLGCNSLVAMMIAGVAAGLLGIATSIIHLRLKVNTMLAGIIISTMAYSVNLRIMGKTNIALFGTNRLFDDTSLLHNFLVIACIAAILIVPFVIFLRTEIGLRFRSVGLNTEFAQRHGVTLAKYISAGLFVANFYSGIAGGLMVQLQSYADIGMGAGIVIHALAALMIGECVVGRNTLRLQMLAPLVGALIYQQIQGVVIFLGLAPTDLKLLTGAIVLAVIAFKPSTKTQLI